MSKKNLIWCFKNFSILLARIKISSTMLFNGGKSWPFLVKCVKALNGTHFTRTPLKLNGRKWNWLSFWLQRSGVQRIFTLWQDCECYILRRSTWKTQYLENLMDHGGSIVTMSSQTVFSVISYLVKHGIAAFSATLKPIWGQTSSSYPGWKDSRKDGSKIR